MPTFFISSKDISDNTVTIHGKLVDHLRGSLRCQINDEISLTDENRIRYNIAIRELKRDFIIGNILGEEIGENPSIEIILGQSIIKGKRMDWLIQKASELGVTNIVPIISERVIARPDTEKSESHRIRWQEIALEASQQSERWEIPVVEPITDLSDFIKCEKNDNIKIILCERDDRKRLKNIIEDHKNNKRIILLIGPEGGFTKNESSYAQENGFISASLGNQILRSETASIYVLSIIKYEYQ